MSAADGWRQRATALAATAGRLAAHPVAAAALLAAPVLLFLQGLLPHPSYLGAFGDIRTFHFWWTVNRDTLLSYGQLPFWNPYECGGMVQWGNVQSMVLAPTTLVSLLFGAGVGLRVHIVVHFLLGSWGCWALSGQQGLRGPWRLAPGVVFVFGANLAERATGHVGFLPFLLLPWLAYAWARTRDEPRWALVCGGLLAYCVFAGAPYPFVFFCVYLGLQVGCDAAAALRRRQPRGAARAAALGGLALAAAVGLAAVQLFVVVDFMSEYPRAWSEPDYLLPWQVWEVFLESPLVRHRKGYFYVFGEYRQYLGPVAMAAVPWMLRRWRDHARDYFIVAVALALMLGNLGPWSPHALLAHLPVFGSLRVPVRWALIADLHVGLLFGHALAAGSAAVEGSPTRPRRVARALLAGALLGCALDLMSHNASQLRGFFKDPPAVAERQGPFRMVRGDPSLAYQGPERHEGHLLCNEPNPLSISPALRAEPPQEVSVVQGEGTAEITEWTPNRVVLAVHAAAAPVRVALNMNYHRDWNAEGGAVEAWRGLLAVSVAPGVERVELWYRPRRIGLYAAISALSLLAALVAWRVMGGRRSGGAVADPLTTTRGAGTGTPTSARSAASSASVGHAPGTTDEIPT